MQTVCPIPRHLVIFSSLAVLEVVSFTNVGTVCRNYFEEWRHRIVCLFSMNGLKENKSSIGQHLNLKQSLWIPFNHSGYTACEYLLCMRNQCTSLMLWILCFPVAKCILSFFARFCYILHSTKFINIIMYGNTRLHPRQYVYSVKALNL